MQYDVANDIEEVSLDANVACVDWLIRWICCMSTE
jgi:hypothetical protein